MSRATALILAAGLLLRTVLAVILPPGYDESYYLFYGQHPALSYFDHPPAVALWSAAGQSLPWLSLWNPVLALRLPCLISNTIALALLASATERWSGARAAWIAAAVGSLSPLLLVCSGLLLLPDSPLILSLSLLMWWLSRHPLNGVRSTRQSLLFGVILGALCLTKYQALLMVLTLLLLRLHDAWQSGAWRWRDTALVLVGWMAVSWPLWVWNAQHGWASFLFHAGRTVATGYQWQGPPLFLLSQLALLFPSIGVLLLVTLFRGRGDVLHALVWPQLVLFLVLAGRMQVLSSWLVPAWWLLLPSAAALLARPERWRRLWFRAVVLTTAVLTPLLSVVAAAHVRWGIASALLPVAADTSGQLLDPAVLRQAIQRNPVIWKALVEAQLVASNRYELPGFMALALRGHSDARFTTYAADSRAFDAWRDQLDPKAQRGVLFAVLGDYAALSSLEAGGQGTPWRLLGPIQKLGTVSVIRAGRVVAQLEFAAFDPSTLRRP